MFTQITDKKRVKLLEEFTVSYMMKIQNTGDYMMNDQDSIKIREFHNWHQDDFDLMHSALYKKVAYISDKLGFKPNYHVNYEGRHAVWGFYSYGFGEQYENILYYSNLGLSLQVDKSMTPFETIMLVKDIISLWEK